MKWYLVLLLILPACSPLKPRYELAGEGRQEYVVLLHGLARSDRSMKPLAAKLESEGYGVCNVGYPSTSMTVPEVAEEVLPEALQRCRSAGATKVHFIGHSMGAMVARFHLEKSPPCECGKLIQLAPPNQGSEVVDKLGDWPLFFRINGPGGVTLGTGETGVASQLTAVRRPTLVVAGKRSINPILSVLIPGDDDGKVAVERTKVAGMQRHMVLPVSHPMIMKDERCWGAVTEFLAE